MFAFAIWNERTKELFLARDRFGIKPLYYYYERGNFVFASEIKGIKSNTDVHTSIDFSAFADYFVYRYVPSPNTIWREVKKLPAANWLLLQPNGVLLQKQYWNPAFAETKLADKDAVQYFDELFLESVKTHTRSDVPVGSFLSGGYDSSPIVHYLSRFGYVPSTFSIGFAGWKISEHLFANMVAEKYGTKHHCLIIESQSLDLLDRLAWFFDEPNGDISTIPTYLVSREASKEVKAVMSGDGGDEILVGYEWQKNFSEVAQKRTWREKLSGFLNASGIPFLLQYYAGAMAMGRFDTAQLKKMMHSDLHDSIQTDSLWHYRRLYNAKLPDLKAMQLLDVKHFLGELVLAKVDRASMANSLEVRVPFLDHEICEWVFSLSSAVYYRNDEAKHLLYQNIKNHLPAQILRRRKQGLVGPDSYYMNIEWYQKHLSESALIKDGIVNSFYVGSLIEAKDHWRLWKLSVMESWYRCWC
jgi:asparagine synthase (glutamine-hydrolysing)